MFNTPFLTAENLKAKKDRISPKKCSGSDILKMLDILFV
jgi:hypothetical protein